MLFRYSSSICAVHSLCGRAWQSCKEIPSNPYFSLWPGAHTGARWRSGATCSTFLGLCPPPDSSDSELELSTVRHQPEGLDQLQAQTKFTKKELQSLYRGFKNVSAPHSPSSGSDPPSPPVSGSRLEGLWPRRTF